ncbi:MAG TPA: tRNA (guanosine(37)-N1)-methyltransferase TrmD [Terriglobia bacterium]|nr:tRNA (guanosine(37)-N1)-methyltransferase TrmD [Terriglobia bacterium]
MVFDVVTIFPDFFTSMLEHGVLKRASAGSQAAIHIHDLRDYTDDRHRTVDDRPFGGGPGMVFKPEPLFRAVEALEADSLAGAGRVILLSPQGRLFSQAVAEELARERRLILICGRYEGVDERVASHLATDELSIGDYVLSGGELAAAVVMEAVTRLLPGVLGNEESSEQDSFAAVAAADVSAAGRDGGDSPAQRATRDGERRGALLDCPHYTRPVEFRGLSVPEVLLSGNHTEIRRWRRRRALLKTWQRRPDLLESFPLTAEDERWLKEFRGERREGAPA